MAILTDPPEWEVPGTKPPRNIIEVVGWEVGSRPPAPWWNWFFYTVAKSLRELETATLARIINEAGVPGIMAGPESERPAASPLTIGRIFIATDTKRIFRDMGGGWDLLNTPEAIGAETPAGAQAKAEAAASAALSGAQAYADQAVAAHAGRTDNPHQVTAAQLGLGDVLAHLVQILDSRIVDHNLDVANPPNGYYVRLDNGLQVCMRLWNQHPFEGTTQGNIERDGVVTWQYPAAFTQLLFAIASGYPAYWGASWSGTGISDYGGITLSPGDNDISPSLALTSIRIRYRYRIYGGRLDIMALAIGRWK